MNGYFRFEYDFGALIKKEREEKGMTLKTLSSVIDVSEMALSRYERGERKLTLKTAEELANELGYSVPELLAKYGHREDYIPAWFDGDYEKWETFKNLVAKEDKKGDAFHKYLIASGYTIHNNKNGSFTIVLSDGKRIRATAEDILSIAEKTNDYINQLFSKPKPTLKKAKK